MSLKYITDEALAQLRAAVPANAIRYEQSANWLDSYMAGKRFVAETRIAVESLPQLGTQDGSREDAKNAIALYQALANLTPVQAMDERLWAYLCHSTYWSYMVARWGTAKPGVIIDRFFLKGGGIGSLVRNGISRLWWSAFLTYDVTRSDPFELTRVLFSVQDIQTGLLQRSLGKSASVRRAALEYFRLNASKIDLIGASKAIQQFMRDLNTAGGVYLLDALGQNAINGILDSSMAGMAA
jgi:Family of unknown function (DUF6339)